MTEPVDHFAEYSEDGSLSAAGETIRTQKEKSQEFLSAQQSRLDGIESSLTEELDRISGCLEQWQTACGEIEEFHTQAAEERREADATISAAEELQLKTQRQRRELAEKFATRRTAEKGKTAETIAKLQERVSQLQEEVDRADLDSLEAKIESLNEQLAEELARGKRLESDARTARDELVESRSESGGLRQQVARHRSLLDERATEISELREQLERITSESDDDHVLHEQLERLRAEREEFRQQLDRLQSESPASTSEELEDLRSKYEMAVENVRSLKNRNEELERELADSDPTTGDSFDWEAKKRELMGDEGSEDGSESSPNISNALKMTDRVIAQKDKKIAELEAKFAAFRASQEKQSTPAPQDGAEQSEEIERLKNEWREKLRAAEVDISVERAQNARVRAELEEKMRDLDAQLALAKKQATVRSNDKPAKGWFRR